MAEAHALGAAAGNRDSGHRRPGGGAGNSAKRRRGLYSVVMRIALGADHAGVTLKDAVKPFLDERGIVYTDFGTTGAGSVDYPDFAAVVARAVARGEFDRGLLFCGSGIGMAIAANKVDGIRAAAVVDEAAAKLSREHNNANVLALGARTTPLDDARRIIDAFLGTPFAGGRHQGRVDKIAALEK
jgi:ribose 5-phosphate isomerase B